MTLRSRRQALTTVLPLAVAASIGTSQYLETTVWTGSSLTDIIWNPASNKVYTANYNTNTVSIIDGATNQVIATVDVPEYPTTLALNTTDNEVYVACSEAGRVAVIDGVGDTLVRTVRVSHWPCAMTYNATMNKVYVASNDDPVYKVTVIDAGPDTVMKYINVHDVGALLWHPVTNRVFCTMGGYDSMISVLDCVSDEVVATPRVPGGIGHGCVNPMNDMVYLSGWRAVWVVSPAGESLVVAIAAWGNVCFVPFPNKLYVLGGGPKSWTARRIRWWTASRLPATTLCATRFAGRCTLPTRTVTTCSYSTPVPTRSSRRYRWVTSLRRRRAGIRPTRGCTSAVAGASM